MKRRVVRFTEAAEQDILGVWCYIAQFSEERADGFVERLREQCAALGRMAGLGRPYPRRPGTRLLSTMGYLILYSINNGDIEILHVIHAARDIEQVLGGPP